MDNEDLIAKGLPVLGLGYSLQFAWRESFEESLVKLVRSLYEFSFYSIT